MFPKQKPFYHPFQNLSLGFSIPGPTNAHEGFEIEDINLYYQPVQEPISGTIFFFIKLSIVLIGCFVHSKILAVMGNDSSIIYNVTKFYLWTQHCPD